MTLHADTAAPPEPQLGRDGKGRFARGNKGGPGNPFGRRIAALRQALLEEVSEEDIRAIARTLKELALQGDRGAAKLLFSYTLGRPAATVDPDRLDIEEFAIYTQEAKSGAQFMTPVNGVPAAVACSLLRTIMPGLISDHLRDFARQFEQRFPDDMAAARAEAARQADTPPPVAPAADTADLVTPEDLGALRPQAVPEPRSQAEQPPAPRQRQPRPARQEAPAQPDLPSVAEILAFLRAGPHAADPTADEPPPDPATVTKPVETGRRAANPGP